MLYIFHKRFTGEELGNIFLSIFVNYVTAKKGKEIVPNQRQY